MEFKYYSSIREVKTIWEDLELPFSSYTTKYELYEELYDFLCSNKIPDYYHYSNPYIMIGLDKGKVIGILPFISSNNKRTLIYNCGFIGYMLPVIPCYLHKFAEKIDMDLSDINHQYITNLENSKYYFWCKANIIDLRNISTSEEYLESLSTKKQKDLKKIINLNNLVVTEEVLTVPNYNMIKKKYNSKWIKNKGFSIACRLHLNDILFKHSNTLTIVCYLNDNIISINKGIIDNNTLLGYSCIRPTTYNNFIFQYSIFKLIELAISKKIEYFNLASSFENTLNMSYKNKFLNTDIKIPCILSKTEEGKPPYFSNKKWIF